MPRNNSSAKTKRTSPIISVTSVDVEIDGNLILSNINWELAHESHWGVVGQNGSGKSTFLALLAGERWPAPGCGSRRYDFGNGPLRDAVAARRNIVTVGPALQDRYAALGWNFSALDVVLSGVFRTDIPRKTPATGDTLRARAVLRDLRIAHLASRSFLQLSRGEQRRVLIARALAFRPRLLLLDEPASGLDRAARTDLNELLARVAERTQLIVTAHTLDQLPSLITDVIELDGGQIVNRPRGNGCAKNSHTQTSAKDAILLSEHSPSTSPAAIPSGIVNTVVVPEDGRADVRMGVSPSVTARVPDTHFSHQTGADVDRRLTPLIQVRATDVWLDGHRALHGIDWTLNPEENWLVTGANGAGKSTFLRLLHGQLRPALGGLLSWPALINTENVWNLRRQISWFSPQLQADYRYRTSVHDCVASGFDASLGLVRSLTKAEHRRVEQLLERFKLVAFADRLTSSLSYGQFRRTLLARALATCPRIMLLDEPWEGLDHPTTELLASCLVESLRDGIQIVCASHVNVASSLWTHELVLSRGSLQRSGPVNQALAPDNGVR